MNKIILVLYILVLLNSCYTQGTHKQSILVNAKITGKITVPNIRDPSSVFYSIKINVINNTDSIIRFRLMSCSWDYNMVFNADAVLFWHTCDKNIPQLLQLKPDEKISFNGKIKGLNLLTVKEQKNLRIGFILIKEKEVASGINLVELIWEKRKEKKDIIWSETPILTDMVY